MPRVFSRPRVLYAVLVVVVLRVLAAILVNYTDYLPPNFQSLFLQGREESFAGLYTVAFYVHIGIGPLTLVNAIVLLSETVRRRVLPLHRWLGRMQVVMIVTMLTPSSLVMATEAFGGWAAGSSFVVLAIFTAGCSVAGVVEARRRRIAEHRRWMHRTAVLLGSAIVLRLMAALLAWWDVDPVTVYVVTAWASWLVPMATWEAITRRRASRPA
jgi:uncharacterized membrane protein